MRKMMTKKMKITKKVFTQIQSVLLPRCRWRPKKRKRSSLRFSPFLCTDILLKFQKRGPCLNFAYCSEVFKHYWRPKREGARHNTSPPKYAPALFYAIVCNRCRHSQKFTMECWTDIRANNDSCMIREPSSL